MFVRNGLVAWGVAVVALGGVAPAAIAQGTERVSLDSAGMQGDNSSADPSISDDGRYVAFSSSASNLVAGDTNGVADVFVRDRVSGVTVRVSVASDGTQANGGSAEAAISADGRHVAFRSFATNLVAGDTNGRAEVFVHDLDSGITERVSVANTGAQSDRESDRPSISADGRYVAFESHATNLVASDTNDFNDVFVRDRVGDTTVRVNVSSAGVEGNQFSGYPSISADGRVVSFQSNASNLVAGDTNGLGDIFVHDLDNATTIRVSLDSAGNQGNRCACDANEISADGRRIAFTSSSTNLVAGDTNNLTDAFVHDLDGETTVRVSVASDGDQADFGSEQAAISADGRHVGFASRATNLVAGDTNATTDVFVRDMDSATTERVSVDSAGNQGNGFAGRPSLSADGRNVAFDASSSNLVAGDTNAETDVFVRDVGADVSASLPAVVRSSTTWYLGGALDGSCCVASFTYGGRPLVPLMGDWDGNGSRTAATFEAGTFKLNNANDSSSADITFTFGHPRGYPVAGDFDGDGTDDVAVFRLGVWQVRLSDATVLEDFTYGSGTWPATVPISGDWDGDGTDGIGVYSYTTATWFLRHSASSGTPDAGSFVYGAPNSSYPVIGDWNGDAIDTVGHKTGQTWTLTNSNSTRSTDVAPFNFGAATDLPLSWHP